MNHFIHLTVANIICRDNQYLMVEEIDNGKPVHNQPAGHVETQEDLIAALKRETIEECGLACEPRFVTGIYQVIHESTNTHFIRICFTSTIDPAAKPTPKDADIISAKWLTRQSIAKDKVCLPRSPLVLQCIDDFEAGQRFPLSIIKPFSHKVRSL